VAAWFYNEENGMKSIYRQFIQAIAAPLLAILLTTTGAFATDWPTGPGTQLANLTLDTPASPASPLDTPPSPPGPSGLDKANPKVQAVMAVQGRQTPGLMATAGVVGTAVGQAADGEVALLVRTESAAVGLPDRIEGVPLVKLVTGKILAMKPPGTAFDPTAFFLRPVPIGVSTGNAG
jgi:hypothetical protein